MLDTAKVLDGPRDTPRIGDRVGATRDVLAEVARDAPGSRSWQLVPAGSAGKVVGWHDPERVAISFDGLVFLVRATSLTRL